MIAFEIDPLWIEIVEKEGNGDSAVISIDDIFEDEPNETKETDHDEQK